MERRIKLLLIEDNEDDAFLLSRFIQKEGYKLDMTRVDDAMGLRQCFQNNKYDAIISDYAMPGFSGSEALGIYKEYDLETPFILLSGTVGEDIAVSMMKAGVHDYIMKDNMIRIVPALEREIKEAQIRSERKLMFSNLIKSEEKFRNIFNSSIDFIVITNYQQDIIETNEAFKNATGYSKNDISNYKVSDVIVEKYLEIMKERLVQLEKTGNVLPTSIEMICKNGGVIPLEINSKLIIYEGQQAILTIARDITERLNMEKRLIDSVIETEENERRRISEDLHDELGPILSSIRMYMNSLQDSNDQEKNKFLMDSIQKLIQNGISSIRELSNNLSPYTLNTYGLVSAINQITESKKHLIPIVIHQNLQGFKVNPNIELIYYRITNELINNTLKYAKASQINIHITYEKGKLHLSYKDNGCGMEINTSGTNEHKGMGINNIINRMKSIDGEYIINSSPGNGFSFIASATTPIFTR